MLSTCANPECATPFDYRQGRLFRFALAPTQASHPLNGHTVQHFWLCEACSETYTMRYLKDQGVSISRRIPPAGAPLRRMVSAA